MLAGCAPSIKLIAYLSGIYGDDITVKRGKVHDYLGMDLDYSTPGKLKVGMIQYPEGILKGSSEEIGTASSTLTADHFSKDIAP